MPEQLSAGQGPGQRVHQAVAVAVRVDRDQSLLSVIGLGRGGGGVSTNGLDEEGGRQES